MHESGVVRSLVAKAEAVVEQSGVAKADRIGVSIGVLSGVDPGAVRAHWDRYASDVVRDAELEIRLEDDPTAHGALGVSLAFVDVGD